MAVNLVVQDGIVKAPALRYDHNSKPELRFTLVQTEKDWPLYLPCTAVGAAAERLASELEDGQHIIVTSGKLCYRKRSTKSGEQSRMEVLVWTVDRLQDDSASGGSVSVEGATEIVQPEPTSAAPATKARRPRYPKTTKERWVPSGLVSEN